MTKKENLIKKIKEFDNMYFNDDQKEIAIKILEKAPEEEAQQYYDFIVMKKRTGFVFDYSPEIAKGRIITLKEDKEKRINVGDEIKDDENKLLIGENYNALKALKITHKNKIDLIYIDPPYNTESAKEDGNQSSKEGISSKFMYKDKFGRGGWLNMMKDRLTLAKDLLTEEGVIFVSIDDSEQAYLKVLMDDIFGEENFISTLIWKSFHSVKNDSINLSQNTEYIITFSKNKKENINEITDKTILDQVKENYQKDDNGNLYILKPVWAKSGNKNKKQELYTFNNKRKWKPEKGTFWRFSFLKLKEFDDNNLIVFNGKNPMVKIYFDSNKGKKPSSLLYEEIVKYTMTGDKQIKSIFNEKKFPNPKPINLIKFLIKITKIKSKKPIILDFFAGSGTTGHAVMDLNKEDNGNRRFILVTNNENNIAENITYERLYRIIKKEGTNGEKDFTWLQKEKNKISYLNEKVRVIKIDDSQKISLDQEFSDELIENFKEGIKLLDGSYNKNNLNLYYDLSALNPHKNLEEENDSN
ncbi:MAG: hypothetical protein TYPL_1760 [Candidatus Tyloplasma litorale]|nr:MAG: hypothetical protein TYPL_1760 [Mycoplasmatales bacterium]